VSRGVKSCSSFTANEYGVISRNSKRPEQSAEQRVAEVFRWCRLAADRGKKGYSFDWRIFGGREWQGHQKEPPTTRLCRKIPASLSVMGTAMREPYLDLTQQRDLLDRPK
jgi:hypothetical protein